MRHENYPLCVAENCPATKCLRQVARLTSHAQLPTWRVLNPDSVKPQLGEQCPYFAHSERVTIARGFTTALRLIPQGNMLALREEFLKDMSLSGYYLWRKGNVLLTPKHQAYIEAIFRRHGYPQDEPMHYDHTYLDYDW